MKTKALFTVAIFLLSLSLVFAQQGFNYQAVARTDAGALLADQSMDMRLSIHRGSQTGILIWQETHAITTNSMGMFDLQVGSGTKTAGSAAAFTDIDWGSNTFYLKVEAKPGAAWLDMGTSQLLAVPFAMTAKTVGSLKKLNIKEEFGNHPDSALFEVKNKDGNTVLAVYNEGVRINVYDPPGVGKGSKGGFAIGGFDAVKGIHPYEFMRVTPDSVRIYVDTANVKRSKGGFAIGGIDAVKGTTDNFLYLTPDNYFIGHKAGYSITTGLYNSFIGYHAGFETTSGSSNVFIGNETGYTNSTGNWNIFVGNNSGYSNTIGEGNILLGDGAGYSNTGGSYNVFVGDLAGATNTTGSDNVFIGVDAGMSNETGAFNVFLGASSGYSNTIGTGNVFLGESSGTANTIGVDNVIIGTNAGEFNVNGNYNVFMGSSSGNSNTTGSYNVFLGETSGAGNTTGISNVFIGQETGLNNSNGAYNVFMGTSSGWSNVSGIGNVFMGQETGYFNTGNTNVAVGALAGYNNITGSNNVFLGFSAGYNETGSNTLYIDNSGANWDQAFIFGDFLNLDINFYADMHVAGDATVNEVWVTSDARFKSNISELKNSLNKVNKLKPVTYNWNVEENKKNRFSDRDQIGLVAQEVELIFPELVKTTNRGYKAVNYNKLTVVLLEALKEQQIIIENLEKRIQALEQK